MTTSVRIAHRLEDWYGLTLTPGMVLSLPDGEAKRLMNAGYAQLSVDGPTVDEREAMRESLYELLAPKLAAGAGLDLEAVRDALGQTLRGTGVVHVDVDDPGDGVTVSSTATQNSSDATLLNRANHTGVLPVSGLTAGSVVVMFKAGSTWPDRSTARTDIVALWIGPDPSPATVASGVGGMHDGDVRLVTP